MIELKKREKVLIIQDCEPDDYLLMIMLNKHLDTKIEFYVLVVSPNAEKHTIDTIKLFDTMGVDRKVTIWQGASYSREKGFVEPTDQSYVSEFHKLFKDANKGSIDVLLATTCYGLMKDFKEEYADKIYQVWHMGGEGVARTVEGKQVRTYGFNWRVGTDWAKVFMNTIPSNKRVFLEPAFYNPDFLQKFKAVSICPKTLPDFIKVLFDSDLPIAKLFVEHNSAWVNKMLDASPECWKFYEKGLQDRYIGPADVLLAFCYLVTEKTQVQDKTAIHIATVERNFPEFGDEKYIMHTVDEISYQVLEQVLIKTFQ
jgi:hypothetical protein